MRLIIEARLEGSETGAPGSEARVVAVIERQDHSVSDLGLTLVEERALLAMVQAGLVVHQTADWTANQAACAGRGAMFAHRDSRTIFMRTVFRKVVLLSLRWLACRCEFKRGEARRSWSSSSPNGAAHFPYRQAMDLRSMPCDVCSVSVLPRHLEVVAAEGEQGVHQVHGWTPWKIPGECHSGGTVRSSRHEYWLHARSLGRRWSRSLSRTG